MTLGEEKSQVSSPIAADKLRDALQDSAASSRAIHIAISGVAGSIRDPLKAKHFDAYADMWRRAVHMAGEAADAMQAMLDRPPDAEPRAYNPATLAKRWLCSEQHVRNMLKRGDLPYTTLGGKLMRIQRSDVEAFESSGGSKR